jgi:hypothetical protein
MGDMGTFTGMILSFIHYTQALPSFHRRMHQGNKMRIKKVPATTGPSGPLEGSLCRHPRTRAH